MKNNDYAIIATALTQAVINCRENGEELTKSQKNQIRGAFTLVLTQENPKFNSTQFKEIEE